MGAISSPQVAQEADVLERALSAAGLDPEGVLSYPVWNIFTAKGLRPALAALAQRNSDMQHKVEYKPLVGASGKRSASTGADELTEADRAHMRSGGRVAFTKHADGTVTKTHVRSPAKTGAPSASKAQPARPATQAELQAIHDRWLSPEAQLAADTRAYTALVDEALALNERRRRGR